MGSKIFTGDSSLNHLEELVEDLRGLVLETVKISLPTLKGLSCVRITDIIRCEADGMYTNIFLLDRTKLMVSKNIKEYEKLLVRYHFIRVHASHLINKFYIKEYITGDGGIIRMDDNSYIPVSRSQKKIVLKSLKQIYL